MTKKHFKAIAENLEYRALVIFNGEATYQEKWYALSTLLALVYDLVQTFSKFNNNFDGGRFIQESQVARCKLELEREKATEIASGI